MKQFESFLLDTANGCLWRGGLQIPLPPKPFEVLRYMVENPGRLVTHDELLDALWPDTFVQPQVLRTYVLELRKLLGDEADHPRFIQTQPKRGYRFVAAVTESQSSVQPIASAVPQSGSKPVNIVGREQELARLLAELEALKNGKRRIVFVTGEIGIGKTALLDAFCREAGSSDAVLVARGQCVEGLGAKERYYPVMEALGHLCDSLGGDTACRTLARFAPAWLMRLDRQLDAVEWAAEPLSAHGRMPGDLCRALEELSCAKPLILAFEDLHWADSATVDLISALARRRAPAKLMVLASYVPRKVTPEKPSDCPIEWLKQDLLVHQCCAELVVRALPEQAIRDLLQRELHQRELPPNLVEFVQSHSMGNPLFALAVLDHLIAQGCLVRHSSDGTARWEEGLPLRDVESVVPRGLSEMIEQEMARLKSEEQSVLEAGSLVPVAFSAWAVAAALGRGLAETEETCDALARRLHFVVRAGEDELPDGTRSTFYAFTHRLYRDVLYQRQAAPRRSERHVRIAEQLGRYFAGREADVAREMARHFEAAGNWRRACEALRSAARSARERDGYLQAAEILDNALQLAQNLSPSERDVEREAICKELESVRDIMSDRGHQENKNPSRRKLTISG
ncbi:MAG TPA: BREX system ATP-binding domain-containing protein [Terracidiphilus sp.]